MAELKQLWRHKDLHPVPPSKLLLITICIVLRMGGGERYQITTMKYRISE